VGEDRKLIHNQSFYESDLILLFVLGSNTLQYLSGTLACSVSVVASSTLSSHFVVPKSGANYEQNPRRVLSF
jgi:hypothetical protein